LLERARDVRRRPLNDEHQDIIESLRTRDPKAARAAMQAHLGVDREPAGSQPSCRNEQNRARLAGKREEIERRAASANT